MSSVSVVAGAAGAMVAWGGKVGGTAGSVTTAMGVADAMVGAEVGVATGVTVGADVAADPVAAGDGSIVGSCAGSCALDEHATGPNNANASRLARRILLVATDGLRSVRFGPLFWAVVLGH